MGKPLIPVATYMATVIEDYIDPNTGEVNCTTLAEDAANRFSLMAGPPTFETPEWVFELAYHVAVREKCRREGRLVSSLGWMINKLESDWF